MPNQTQSPALFNTHITQLGQTPVIIAFPTSQRDQRPPIDAVAFRTDRAFAGSTNQGTLKSHPHQPGPAISGGIPILRQAPDKSWVKLPLRSTLILATPNPRMLIHWNKQPCRTLTLYIHTQDLHPRFSLVQLQGGGICFPLPYNATATALLETDPTLRFFLHCWHTDKCQLSVWLPRHYSLPRKTWEALQLHPCSSATTVPANQIVPQFGQLPPTLQLATHAFPCLPLTNLAELKQHGIEGQPIAHDPTLGLFFSTLKFSTTTYISKHYPALTPFCGLALEFCHPTHENCLLVAIEDIAAVPGLLRQLRHATLCYFVYHHHQFAMRLDPQQAQTLVDRPLRIIPTTPQLNDPVYFCPARSFNQFSLTTEQAAYTHCLPDTVRSHTVFTTLDPQSSPTNQEFLCYWRHEIEPLPRRDHHAEQTALRQRAAALKARFGKLPARWPAYSDAEIATHLSIHEKLRKGEIALLDKHPLFRPPVIAHWVKDTPVCLQDPFTLKRYLPCELCLDDVAHYLGFARAVVEHMGHWAYACTSPPGMTAILTNAL